VAEQYVQVGIEEEDFEVFPPVDVRYLVGAARVFEFVDSVHGGLNQKLFTVVREEVPSPDEVHLDPVERAWPTLSLPKQADLPEKGQIGFEDMKVSGTIRAEYCVAAMVSERQATQQADAGW